MPYFDENSEVVPVVDFDFDVIDPPPEPDIIRAEAGELLLRLLDTFKCRNHRSTANAIGVVTCLAGGESISATARKFHLSRTAVRKIANKFKGATGVRLIA